MKLSTGNARFFLVATTLAVASLGLACGGNSNKATSTATRVATQAATPVDRATAVASRQPSGTVARATAPSSTPAPTATPDPQFVASALKLSPLLLQTTDLPADLKDLQPSTTGPIAISNDAYCSGLPNCAEITKRLNADGRLSGVRFVWQKQAQYTPGLQTVYVVDDDISEYKTADGAKDGLALVFQNIQSAPTGTDSSNYRATQLAGVSPVGDEMQAYRLQQTQRAAIGNNSQITSYNQVTYIVGWRRGAALGTVEISAVNMDPSLDDLNRLISAQDAKLKAAGY